MNCDKIFRPRNIFGFLGISVFITCFAIIFIEVNTLSKSVKETMYHGENGPRRSREGRAMEFASSENDINYLSGVSSKNNVSVDVDLKKQDYIYSVKMNPENLCSKADIKKTFPNVDYAMMGYNYLTGFPLSLEHDPGFAHKIFKGNFSREKQTTDCQYSLPDGMVFVPDVFCSVSFSSEVAKTASEVAESSGTGASLGVEAGGGYGGISAKAGFSASKQFKEMKSRMQEEEKISILSKASCGYYYGYQDPVNPPDLDDSFLEFVEKNLWMKTTGNLDAKFNEFFQQFGTHFIIDIGNYLSAGFTLRKFHTTTTPCALRH